MTSPEKREELVNKEPNRYHERVWEALLHPDKTFSSAYEIASYFNDRDNRSRYSAALNDYIALKQVFKKDGVLVAYVDKKNPYVHAFWRMSQKNPNLLHNTLKAIKKDKNIREFFRAAMNNETKKIIEDCRLKPPS